MMTRYDAVNENPDMTNPRLHGRFNGFPAMVKTQVKDYRAMSKWWFFLPRLTSMYLP